MQQNDTDLERKSINDPDQIDTGGAIMGMLEGKVAIITGAAQGMGEKHAIRFVKEGAKVVLTDIQDAPGQALAEKLGENAVYMHLDVTSESQWADVAAKTEEKFGPITTLVNNAGYGKFLPMDTLSGSDYERHMNINFMGIFYGIKAVIASMRRAGNGSIINISSVDGVRGAATGTAYCAAKHAVEGLTKAAAVEYGKDNIRVNCINPGIIKTPMSEADADPALIEFLKQMEKGIPLARRAEAEEVSGPVAFLASDDSSYVSGTSIIVDGGYICHI